MRIRPTTRAREVIRESQAARRGELTITIGTGCCESTAPFLYEDFWPGPDQARVGEVEGVPVYAPDYLRRLYGPDEVVVLDAIDELAESLSIETEFGCRLVLRGDRSDPASEPQACESEPRRPIEDRRVVGEMPEELRRIRLR